MCDSNTRFAHSAGSLSGVNQDRKLTKNFTPVTHDTAVIMGVIDYSFCCDNPVGP